MAMEGAESLSVSGGDVQCVFRGNCQPVAWLRDDLKVLLCRKGSAQKESVVT